ncbi:hypothetical protein EW145_g6970 [Phellinidium pouzarii]|uniref:37S ribosomal protein S35, mitochondrial n=1 Tax=Phellinidium pouzarii TaxID=167371 RepID=A0A4S4KR67_9AGAM|nr:hypothetical protein EW145_g6970 [Phellinidium pouzarii]
MPARAALRPRVPAPRAQPIFSRGARIGRLRVGDQANEWLRSENGLKFEKPSDGPNWLGKERPFPMNHTFQPPPPIAESTKYIIHERFMSNPQKFNVSVLSVAFGISMKRIDAILRLKGLEESWKKGKELQTGFAVGMERMLKPTELVIGNIPRSRRDVNAADMQDESEADDQARDRYQRLFWEPVVDGEEAIVPQLLEEAKEELKSTRIETMTAKSNDKLLTGREGKKGPVAVKRLKTIISSPGPGRPVTVFKDVGGRYLDVEERVRRMHEADRRRQAKEARRDSQS